MTAPIIFFNLIGLVELNEALYCTIATIAEESTGVCVFS